MKLSYIIKSIPDTSTADVISGPQSDWLHDISQGQSDSNMLKAKQNGPLPSADSHIPRDGIDTLTAFYGDMINQLQLVEAERLCDILPPGYDQNATRSTAPPKGMKGNILEMHNEVVEIMLRLVWRQNGVSILPEVVGFTHDWKLMSRLRELFYDANDEVFEDGMASNFSNELRSIILERGVMAIDHIRELMRADYTSIKVTEEVLRQVGHMSDIKTHHARLSLLECALESSDLRIRDAASIGIEAMEDPSAIPSLKRAIESESSEWLREYLKDVIAQLDMHNEVLADH